MDTTTFIRITFYVCSAVAAIFLVEAIYLALAAPIRRKHSINRRLKTQSDGIAGEQILLTMRAERGIFGDSLEFFGPLRRLLVQSGLRITLTRFVFMLLLMFAIVFSGMRLLTAFPLAICFAAAAVAGLLLPLQIVKFIRSRRQYTFTTQLPEALDVVVRSLRSGHPVQVAFSMVGREMQDPIGSEFGITIDEMTYGHDMTQALNNLADRVGVADLSLLVTAVGLQNKSGGNLSEVLSNLSKVLRDRFQLRRKVRSLSSEGRFSAWGLAILPVIIAGAIFVQNPGYYLDVWDHPSFLPSMYALLGWAVIGNIIMFKMINFKY